MRPPLRFNSARRSMSPYPGLGQEVGWEGKRTIAAWDHDPLESILLRGVAHGAIAPLSVPPGQGHGILEALEPVEGPSPAVPPFLSPSRKPESLLRHAGGLFGEPRQARPSSGLTCEADENQRFSVVLWIEARPTPCVSGHGNRISYAIRRMLMRLPLSATAWIAVGMPLGPSQDAYIMVGLIVTLYAFAFPGLIPHATRTSFRSLGQSRVMPIRGIARAVPKADHGRRAGGGIAPIGSSSPQDQPGDYSMSDSATPAGRPTRRQFAKIVAGTAVGAFAAPAIVRGRNLNDKLNIAMIATGGRGGFNLRQAAIASENIVALCDVYEPAVDEAAQMYPRARRYRDFRRVYDRANDFDAVVVSTTEHTHAFATLPALQLGKHVYCEKPLTYNIWEARVIREAAAKAKVATQMGNQNHSNDNYRRVVELIRSGAIGPVREVHVWVSRAWGRQPPEAARKNERDGVLGASGRPRSTPSRPGSTGSCGSARRRRGRSTTSTSPGRSGIGGGTSATAR